jgi:hypothetical protein
LILLAKLFDAKKTKSEHEGHKVETGGHGDRLGLETWAVYVLFPVLFAAQSFHGLDCRCTMRWNKARDRRRY